MTALALAPDQRTDLLDRLRGGATHGRGVIVTGPIGTEPTGALAGVREQLREHFATIITAAPALGRLGLICDAFGGTEIAPDVRAALVAEDELWLPQLHGALTRWVTLLRANGRGPILLVGTDIHWCDAASAAVLGMLMRQPIAGLVTLVGGHSGEITDLLRTHATTKDRLVLGPLSAAELRARRPHLSELRASALVESGHGLPAFAAVLDRQPLPIVRAVDRLAIAELAELLDEDLVRQWCGDLDEDARLALATAAASGPRVDVGRVAEACALPAMRVHSAVGAALRDGLLADRYGAIRFVHPLIRGACYRLVGSAARQVIHAGLARTMATATHGSDEALDHLAAAGSVDAQLAGRMLEGCERLLELDPRSATRVAASIRSTSGLAAAQRVRAGLVQARGLEAIGSIRAARDLARELEGVPAEQVEVGLLAARCERTLGNASAARALVIGSGAPESCPERLIELAAIAAIDPSQAPVSWRSGGSAAPALAVLGATRAERWPDVAGVRASAADAVQAASAVLDGLEHTAYGSLVEHLPGLVLAMVRLGFIDAAAYQLDRAGGHARHRVDLSAQVLTLTALVDLHRGRLAAAADHSCEAVELAHCAELPRLALAAEAVLALTNAYRDGPELPARAQAFVLEDVADPWQRLTAQTLVEYCLVSGDYPRSRELLLRLGWVGGLTGDASVVAALRAVTELHLGQADQARDALAAAAEAAHAVCERARVAEAAAVVALATGQVDLAQADARVAVRLHGRAGAVLAEARSRVVLAEALRAAGDLAGAEREAGLAKSTFAGIGATHLARRVVSVQKRIAATASRGLCAGEFGLSPREAEIAQLVCSGLTNREIGTKLYLSVRTVDTHVARVLTKVGVNSRVALAHMFAEIPVAV